MEHRKVGVDILGQWKESGGTFFWRKYKGEGGIDIIKLEGNLPYLLDPGVARKGSKKQ